MSINGKKNRGTMSYEGFEWLKVLEGKKINSEGKHILYDDGTGVITQGYGIVRKGGTLEELQLVYSPQTEDEAGEEFTYVLRDYEKTLNQRIKNRHLTVEQKQFDALLALEYNYGTGSKKVLSALAKLGHVEEVKKLWSVQYGISLPGLIKRRESELTLFFNGEYTNPYS